MNSNAFHNIVNGVIVLIGVASQIFGSDLSALGITPDFSLKVVAFLGSAKLVVNAIRDGFGGMFAEQPPVAK